MYIAPAGPDGDRGYRPGRSACLEQSMAAMQASTFSESGRRPGPGAVGDLPGMAPKSDAAVSGIGRGHRRRGGTAWPTPVPCTCASATRAMKEWGYAPAISMRHNSRCRPGMECLPCPLYGKQYYEPTDAGRERIAERLAEIESLKRPRGRNPKLDYDVDDSIPGAGSWR